MNTKTLTADNFYLDSVLDANGGTAIFPGYTFGDHWNGFATPAFTKEQGLRIVAALNKTYETSPYRPDGFEGDNAWYDAERDLFVDYCDEETGETEEWEGMTFDVDGTPTRLYSIGAYCWCWTTWDEEEQEAQRLAREEDELLTRIFEVAVDNMEVHPDDFEWASDAWEVDQER